MSTNHRHHYRSGGGGGATSTRGRRSPSLVGCGCGTKPFNMILIFVMMAVFLLCCNNIRMGVDFQQQYNQQELDAVHIKTNTKHEHNNNNNNNIKVSHQLLMSTRQTQKKPPSRPLGADKRITTIGTKESPHPPLKTVDAPFSSNSSSLVFLLNKTDHRDPEITSNRMTTTTSSTIGINSTTTNTTLNSTPKKKNLTHFIFHIPKTGATYAHSTIVDMILNDPKWQSLPKSDKFQPCNQAKESLEDFDSRYNYETPYNHIKCSSWMSEVPYSNLPRYRYTILRDPVHHVISQYFHCRESKSHEYYKERMPKRLIIWLNIYLQILKDDDDDKKIANDPLRLLPKSDALKFEESQMICYNPINLQSYMTQFNALEQSSDDLQSKYNIIGNTQQMTQTICAIVIHMTNGWIIPNECNCTIRSDTTRTAKSNSTTPTGSNIVDDEQQQQQEQRRRRNLIKEYNVSIDNHAHGVIHHGATYEASVGEKKAIDMLTKYDQALYDMSKKVFAKQLSEIESKYQIKICERFPSTE